ncbi:amidase [Roseomonas frigidaquae]|uniref:Amidase n=1 Tax=Falsiroseomonas frigidaquae TaxID=487318 RepID=A0ABX1EU23_9PROT|nr:amidase [Falsiroseomonas frigidaquae]NKE44126.1 amidase [Falsiroseomonas frigidaquae]
MSPFVPGTDIRIEGRPGGPLSGLRFAAKDLFDIAGHPTGGGNPDWARQNPLPTRHAWAVQTLLDAGATLIGKTITDEVSLGILGENAFDGTPLNPAAPGHVPGGSSSGSASAVAQGFSELALGTDTGGSVRVPASFCGLYGIRPTHGRLNLTGMLPQAPSSDTTGWFARDAATFARVSEVLLQEKAAEAPPTRLVIAVDAFGFAEPETAAALEPMLDRLKALIPDWREEVLAPPGLVAWGRAQRTLQPVEAWETFRPWIERDNPRFAFSVARGLVLGAATPEAERGWAALTRQEVRGRLRHLLPPGTVLAMPTTPFPAPRAGLPLSALNPIRDQILSLCAVGGLAGHPQISLPGASVAGRPVGLSLIAARGGDTLLLRAALEMEKA